MWATPDAILAETNGWTPGEVLGAVGTLLSAAAAALIYVWKHRDQSQAEQRKRELAEDKQRAEDEARETERRLAEFYKVLELYKTERIGIYRELNKLRDEHLECRQAEARLTAENKSQANEISRCQSEIVDLRKRLETLEHRVRGEPHG